MGIDYGMGKTNIDLKTGIRYGVIPVHEVTQAWCDDSEPDYGPPTCPKCGNETINDLYEKIKELMGLKENQTVNVSVTGPGYHEDLEDVEHWCCHCGESVDDDGIFECCEPNGYFFNSDGYKAGQAQEDSDIMIVKSPYYTFCGFCSPCAPGAGYLLDQTDIVYSEIAVEGADCKAYCFGHDWFEDGKAPYRVFRVDNDEEVFPE